MLLPALPPLSSLAQFPISRITRSPWTETSFADNFLPRSQAKTSTSLSPDTSALKMVTRHSMPPRSKSAISPCPHRWSTKRCRKDSPEQRDQLKLPDNVKDLKVENGELVFVEK